jgi:hypothetical protein
MSKTARRVASGAPRAARAELQSLRARRDLPATTLFEGHVHAVDEQGRVRGVLAGGEAVEAAAPAHIDVTWLREAAAREPVAAAFTVASPSGRYILWGLFPGPAHADVRVDVVVRGRNVRVDAESLHLSARGSQIRLEPDGNVNVRGRDVTSHARRVNRIKGGSIRLN